MEIIADLHLHSKYSRAVSQKMVTKEIWQWAKRKGIELVATGDWTHPLWMREIKANLEEMGNGLLKLRTKNLEQRTDEEGPYFLLSTELSSIYSQGGRLRRIHTLVWSPSIETCEKINKELLERGANLMSDGRPILGLSSIELSELVLSIDPSCLIIPAHVWTPWYSLYGSQSGFDSIDECFGKFSKYIYAIETGLSSDPAMNWRIKELDGRAIVSFSDAHSGPKLGREATVFSLKELSYQNIRNSIIQASFINKQKLEMGSGKVDNEVGSGKSNLISHFNNPASHITHRTSNSIIYTIEFYPEEGKYHYTGHRNCGIKQSPSETKQKGAICPVCGRKLTIGVMHRVEQLAGGSDEELRIKKSFGFGTYRLVHPFAQDKQELSEIKAIKISSEAFSNRPPYVMLVPLQEILAEALESSNTSQKVQNEYEKLTDSLGGEFAVLLKSEIAEIKKVSGERVGEAVYKVRAGEIVVDPGYDGVFGIVKIWGEEKKEEEKKSKEQLSLF